MSEENIIAIASDAAVRLTAMEFEEIMKLQILRAEVNAKAGQNVVEIKSDDIAGIFAQYFKAVYKAIKEVGEG